MKDDAHALAYSPPARFADGQSRCRCGWVSKRTSPARTVSAWKQHRAAVNMRARKQRLVEAGTYRYTDPDGRTIDFDVI